MGANRGGASRGTKGGMNVRRIKEEVDPDFLSDAHSRTGPAESGDSCESKMVEWIVRFPFNLLFADIVDTSSLAIDGARVAFEDEFGAAEESDVSCEAQQGQSGVKRKLFGSCRNNMGNEPILALLEGSDNFIVMRIARARMLY
ncbi:hypothetical protein Tco_0659998 [Tanacetum coccineum]